MQIKEIAKKRMDRLVQNQLGENLEKRKAADGYCPWPYLIYSPKKPTNRKK